MKQLLLLLVDKIICFFNIMVAILYTIVSHVQDVNSPHPYLLLEKSHKPNVIVLPLEIEIETKLEVYLVDILKLLLSSTSEVGYKYKYFAVVRQEVAAELNMNRLNLVCLYSPSSLVPIRKDGTVRLIFSESILPPIIPLDQCYFFADASRRQLYSANNYKATADLALAFYEEHEDRRVQLKNERNNDIGRHKRGSSHQTNARTLKKDNNTGPSGDGVSIIPNIVSEEAVTALAEAAGVVGRSLFNFATMGLKTVNDIADAVNANASRYLSANAVINVGNTKVRIVKQLAEGAFGIVFLAQDAAGESANTTYALKQLICQSKEQVKDAHQELEALKRFRGHPNIIPLLDHASNPLSSHTASSSSYREVMMLFPLCPRGTTWDAMVSADIVSPDSNVPWPFNERKILYIISCIAKALQFMHDKGFAHRDVKPHNILLADPPATNGGSHSNDADIRQVGIPLLMDFGSVAAARCEVKNKSQGMNLEEEAASKTSAAYRAPELTSVPYPPCVVDEQVDTWALGCTMFCLAFGRSPFETPKEGVVRLGILNGRYQVPAGRRMRNCTFSEQFEKSFIQPMLQVESKMRPSMTTVAQKCEDLLNSRK